MKQKEKNVHAQTTADGNYETKLRRLFRVKQHTFTKKKKMQVRMEKGAPDKRGFRFQDEITAYLGTDSVCLSPTLN